MALAALLADIVYTGSIAAARGQAAGQAGAATVLIDPKTIARTMYRKYKDKGDGTLYNIAEFRSVVERAVDSYIAGRNMEDAPGNAPPPGTFPIDPTARGGPGTYRYRVVVVIDDGQGHRQEFLHVEDSNRPLSQDDLYAAAQNAVWEGRTPSVPAGAGSRDWLVRDVIVVSAGRG